MNRSPRAGFSLLHMILLLVVMTLIASAAIPAFFGRSEVILTNAVELFARDVRDAQDRAAFQHRAVRVVFDEDGDGYTIVDGNGHALEAPVGEGDFLRKYSIDAVFRGVRIEALEIRDRELRYTPRGIAEYGGKLRMTFDGAEHVIEVEATTGDVTVDGEPMFGR